jgi:hypothetical protein
LDRVSHATNDLHKPYQFSLMHTHATSTRLLDQVAISMAVICGIHCLVTPLLLVALPIIATTFWVDQNFHLWMLLLVIPTTSLAVWSGCRRHRDRWVFGLAAVGLSLLVVALVQERVAYANAVDGQRMADGDAIGSVMPDVEALADGAGHLAVGGCCALHPLSSAASISGEADALGASVLPWHLVMNVLGGLLLASGHTRNFLLCRKSSCSH